MANYTYSPHPLWLAAARFRAIVWRFRTLRLAHSLFDRLPGSTVLARPFCGFNLHIDVQRSNAQKLLYLEGERFVAERHILRGLLKPGMRVADVGANIGYYTLLFAQAVGPCGSIIAFEPEPNNLGELSCNIAKNQLGNVTVVAKAVGAKTGSAPFMSGINGGITVEGKLQVPVCRLDDVLVEAVDFIKIDVEGFEGHVLEGARRTLEQHRPTLFLELHPSMIEPPHSVQRILHELGEYYPCVELLSPPERATSVRRWIARYFGSGVRSLTMSRALAAEHGEPFWVVCRR